MEVNEVYKMQEEKSKKAIEVLKKDFNTLRSGRVSVHILDNIRVEYYGQEVPLNQVATVLATDATTIVITPWEKGMLKEIERAIQEANIGVNPNNDGTNIKLFFPPMTIEEREKIAKEAKAFGEKAKVAIRNVRKEANNKIKQMEKEKLLSEDEAKVAHEKVQEITDKFIKEVDSLVKAKQEEIMKV